MKKIVWHLTDCKGKRVYGNSGLATRQSARMCKEQLHRDIFEEWNDDIAYPLRIEREEWELLSKKVVR